MVKLLLSFCISHFASKSFSVGSRKEYRFVMPQGLKPQAESTEIFIEMKQLYSGRMASFPFIASNRRYRLFPLRFHFIIENGLLD